VSVARLRRNGRAISSTWIRELLAAGEIAEASRLLGYTYFCEGLVQAGRRLGRKLGFPTLNLAWAPEARPAYGVYAVRLYTEELKRGRPGVANYGLRPTVAKEATGGPLLETHLLGTKQVPGPGQKIRVEWREFLRAERKFASLEALRTQIAKDKKAAAGYFRKK
jgi:riboflavin kinase/FMN adenylyltransferase